MTDIAAPADRVIEILVRDLAAAAKKAAFWEAAYWTLVEQAKEQT